MKRMITRTLTVLLCISALVSSALAAEPDQITERVDYEDGSFLTITTTVYPVMTRASSRYATKEFAYTDAAGDKAFSYTLQGWFTYDNQTSEATNASAIIDIFKSGWTLNSNSEYCRNNTAYGRATFKGPAGLQNVSGSITCDRYGNIR